MSVIKDMLNTLMGMMNGMSPYLLLGFLFAGILHVFVPKQFYRKHLSKENFKSVLLSALFGIPLPLCSCGVIPTAMSLRREGVSRAATISFLTATPQTGIDSILATYAIFGAAFAVLRPVAALVTAILSGMVVALAFRKRPDKFEESQTSCPTTTEHGGKHKLLNIFKYGFVDMIQDLGGHLIVGLLLAGLITVAVPDSFLLKFADYPLLEMLVVLLFAIPMYVCSTGSIPIAAALMLKGLSPGAALVFLMAGPASNMASIMVIRKVMGYKSLWLYLAGVVAGSLGFGMLVNTFMPAEWFNPAIHGNVHAGLATPWWKWTATAIFTILLIHALIRKYIHNAKKDKVMKETIIYRVNGMVCNHCKNSVETNISKLDGVTNAEVDLGKCELSVTGTTDETIIRKTIESLGYEFKGKVTV